ncbi:hypothetical protein COEREDRAFT_79114 [Coemansia reversa NRRL 1564]|uniref:Uncharacterized protein n=1 Tax=Coemansia reversa (strain ATCC 12441 / NRRL 1564) TaxID=763665 RepID=A0A2G5BJF5_COERN|nr:hypothetical protein COEREDRAFT_79114 [Coemansia reversa NRRL 1564]|eukprot:PIA19136.1 hypothetical protein COEREDRAFT_79114 [Coemansia reversa NRRL 1564]
MSTGNGKVWLAEKEDTALCTMEGAVRVPFCGSSGQMRTANKKQKQRHGKVEFVCCAIVWQQQEKEQTGINEWLLAI